jgi:hypothetical protein
VLGILFALLALVPLAHASPPDPVWVAGIYDAADFDEVVSAATALESSAERVPAILFVRFHFSAPLAAAHLAASDARSWSLRPRAPPAPA